jgi:hypothetical protein
MDIPWRSAVLVVAGAFIVFLLAKLLPFGRPSRGAGPGLVAARGRIRDAKTPRDRAAALCDAAEAAMGQPFGSTRAAGYFLRAMRADAAWAGSVERAAAAFAHRRVHLLEGMLWRRLAATPWDREHAEVLRALVTALASANRRARRHAAQAEVFERILAGEPLSLDKR